MAKLRPPGGKGTGDHSWATSASALASTSKGKACLTPFWGLCYQDDKGAHGAVGSAGPAHPRGAFCYRVQKPLARTDDLGLGAWLGAPSWDLREAAILELLLCDFLLVLT